MDCEKPLIRTVSDLSIVAERVYDRGFHHFKTEVLPLLHKGLLEKDSQSHMYSLLMIKALSDTSCPWVSPYILPMIHLIIQSFGSKNMAIQKAAEEAGLGIVHHIPPPAVSMVLPRLLQGLDEYEWRCKIGTLHLIQALTTTHPVKIGPNLPLIIPRLVQEVHSTKKEVRESSRLTLHHICSVQDNPDLAPTLPYLLDSYIDPLNCTMEAIDRLYSTSFIQPIDSTALGLIVPVLTRGMKIRKNVYKRRCAVIMDSVCKLITDPHDILVFFPQLEAILLQGQEEIDKEEIRNVCTKTLETLYSVKKESMQNTKTVTYDDIKDALETSIHKHCVEGDTELVGFMAHMAHVLLEEEDEDVEDWHHVFEPYLGAILDKETARQVSTEVTAIMNEGLEMDQNVDDDAEEDLCNAEFSLAYGSRVLLHQTSLHLKRGRRYGLVGKNGAGKSTLMRAIAHGNLQGFPSEIRTVYVEHDIQGNHSSTTVLCYILEDEQVQSTGCSEDAVRTQLQSVGFDASMQEMPITSLSGGWRMKLALSRAILTDPDVLLLDEPTNHLDKYACQWIISYIKDLTRVTCLIVSHDTSFLDEVCTDIIHFEANRKLKRYRGNLSEFVKQKPEARSYYELRSDIARYNFPAPGPLLGVKSQTKAVLKLQHVSHQYLGTDRRQLEDVSVQVSLASRVAIIGVNGAGKSTLIRLLVGELELQSGTLYRHPNVRIAYVAQHAFHHIEHHLDKSPCQYIMWRCSGGVDKEMSGRDSLLLTTEEWSHIQELAKTNKTKIAEKIVGRVEGKREMEYEVKWVDMDETQFIGRTELVQMGYQKWILQLDEVLSQGTMRKLTTAEIVKHYEEFGLEENFSVHGTIGGLSGGQKVKVVLGAAMWNKPHIVILDEPTNFLDRDSLGALTLAIKDFEGGVLLISHNAEFYSALCNERWVLEDGRLHAEGEKPVESKIRTVLPEQEEDITDAFGNTLKPTTKKAMDRSERKRLEKKRKEMLKNGQDTYELDELLGLL